MAYLPWISDDSLLSAVVELIEIAKKAQNRTQIEFTKNVIDPFSAMFQIAGFGIDYQSWIISEQTRQSQKTLQNYIGDFHQTILGSLRNWKNLKTGNIIDLVSDELKVIAEVKNKHNTVKGSNLSDLYNSLENVVMPKSSKFKEYTAYYVTIIPKSPDRFDKPFTPSDTKTGTKMKMNDKIRIIDGASFYSFATGVDNSLQQMFEVLPSVLFDCTGVDFSSTDIKNLNHFFDLAFS